MKPSRPTPWKWVCTNDDDQMVDANGHCVIGGNYAGAYCLGEGTETFVDVAINSHEKLVEACHEALGWVGLPEEALVVIREALRAAGEE